jgi:hypothetical protein
MGECVVDRNVSAPVRIRGIRRAGSRPAPETRAGLQHDNLPARKGERAKELLDEKNCELLYLPPY